MNNQINHNPVNDPDFPISPVANSVEDTEGHARMRVDEADESDTIRRAIEDTEDAEGHIRLRVEDADDAEGRRFKFF
ncbi:hypothetical protein [Ilumatobacter nonamiensis]|uniref:hypothetical protein n=1 Tax=Ilumatobacter nonamiensis TaxID=467093 RepID=UPI000684EE94|nr:hypothetical protein [Ilumatobacter nonamiensis]